MINDPIGNFLACLERGSFPIDAIPYDIISNCERVLKNFPQADGPVESKFVNNNGLNIYVRTLRLSAGQILTSKLHKTRHPFVVTEGVITIFSTTNGLELIKAPYYGITQPGTKRLAYVNQDTVWTTYHITNASTVSEAEREIIEEDETKINTFLCLSQ